MANHVLTVEVVAKLLVQKVGNMAAVAKACGVTRTSVFQFIQSRPELKQLIEDAKAGCVDYAETGLYSEVRKKKAWAVTFALERAERQDRSKKLEEIAEKVDKLAGLAEIGMGLEHLLAAAQIETPAPDEMLEVEKPNTGGDSWAKLLEEAG